MKELCPHTFVSDVENIDEWRLSIGPQQAILYCGTCNKLWRSFGEDYVEDERYADAERYRYLARNWENKPREPEFKDTLDYYVDEAIAKEREKK